MYPKESITGIILAGGESSRLGFDKGLMLYRGLTWLDHSIGVLSPFCERIIISTNNDMYHFPGTEVIPDILPGNGPMMGLYSSLTASVTYHNLVIAVDNLFIGREFYEYVINRMDDSLAALPYPDEKYFEPLTGYYSKGILPVIKAFIDKGNFKLPDLLNEVNVTKLKVQEDFLAYHPLYFKSINLPEDLLLLE